MKSLFACIVLSALFVGLPAAQAAAPSKDLVQPSSLPATPT